MSGYFLFTGGNKMADKKTVDKVKELLTGFDSLDMSVFDK